MHTTRPELSWISLAATSFVATALVTLAVFLPFFFWLQGCEGLGCLGSMAYWPIAIVASAVIAIVVAARVHGGWSGYGLSLLAGAGGFLATNIGIWELRLFPS